MTSDIEEGHTPRRRVVYLEGNDNYKDWDTSIEITLIQKDLIDVADGSEPRPADESTTLKAWRRQDRKAWGYIVDSLSPTVRGALPARFTKYSGSTNASSYLLLEHLRNTYSAVRGARMAELYHTIWASKLDEGADPSPHLSRIRQAHTSVVQAGSPLSDLDVCFAILSSLPPSYRNLVQSYYHERTIDYEDLCASIRTEWRRQRDSGGEDTTALLAKVQEQLAEALAVNANAKSKSRTNGPYCSYHQRHGHSTTDCFAIKKKRESEKALPHPGGEGNMAVAENGITFVAHTTIKHNVLLTYASRDDIVVDSGASHHMVHNEDLLTDRIPLSSPVAITVGNGAKITATEKGSLNLRNLTLRNVLHVPELGRNLLSVGSSQADPNILWTFSKGKAILRHHDSTLLTASLKNGLYMVDPSSRPHSAALLASVPDSILFDWHRRLGHLNVRSVVRLGKEGRLDNKVDWGLVQKDIYGFQCPACIQGKGKRLPSPSSDLRATRPLYAIHVDLWGPARTPSHGGNRYFLTCYDDYSRKINLTFLKRKSDARQALINYINLVENQLDCTVKTVRSDLGSEFKSLRSYFLEKGIEHHTTPPTAHAQNGRVERAHLTILDTVRTLLLDAGLPDEFWAEAANYAVYTRNRAPSGRNNKVPEDIWRGREVHASHAQPFGCPAYFRDHTNTDKLRQRYKEGRLLSYEEGTLNYRIWDTDKRKAIISRDVVFQTPTTSTPGSSNVRFNHYNRQYDQVYDIDDATDAPMRTCASSHELVPNAAADDVIEPEEIDNDEHAGAEEEPDIALLPRHRGWEWQQDDRYDRSPAPSPEPEEPPQPEEVPGPRRGNRERHEPERYDPSTNFTLVHALVGHALISTATPQSFGEAHRSAEWPQWLQAIQDELAKMDKYEVWTVTDRVPGIKPLKAKWVFTRKIDGETGKPSAYKARWVAKGFQQREGVDYNELFASVAHKDSIRVFLALVNYLNLECDQVDIKAAFLNGDLPEIIYLEPPEGSNIPSHKVLLLRKSLYGLKQSPRCFNKAFDQWLQEQGLVPTHADPCIYTWSNNGIFLLLSVHVDDQLIACNSRAALDEFKAKLNKRFECSDGGPVAYFLGFNVFRNRSERKLYISQEHYIEAVLERFGMTDCRPVKTPLPSGFKSTPVTDEEFTQARHEEYPALVGSIMYAATITRPDIALAAGLLARAASKWSKSHVHAARHLLRYLRGTSDLCLTFDATSGKRIVLGYADADWGGCLDTRRSTTGYLFKTFGGPVAWKSKRQATTALSTTEAEYMASADATRQAVWLRQLLKDLGQGLEGPLPILNDNNAAILLSKNPVNHDRSKHIDIRHHFLRDKVSDNAIDLSHVPTEDNLADILTKPLGTDTFTGLRDRIGVGPVKATPS
jgi:hypothetical protein